MTLSLIRRFAFVLTFGVFLGLIAPIGAAAVVEDSPDGGSSQASNLQLAHAVIDRVFNDADADAAASLIDDDAVLHTSFGDYTGPEGLLDYVSFVKRTYPDAVFDIASARADGGTIVIAWRVTASEMVLDPYELPLVAQVDITETATLQVENDQVAGITLDARVLTLTDPGADTQVAYVPLPGQPY